MSGAAALVPWPEVSDSDSTRSNDGVDVDKGGMRPNATATMSSGGEGSAAEMAMTDAKPAQNIALTCAQKL
jgi:hypothetical protein